jgi:hypothetical protein
MSYQQNFRSLIVITSIFLTYFFTSFIFIKTLIKKIKIEIVENSKVCEEFEFTKVFEDLSK